MGELAANPFGLFDVHGNVSEWTADGWKPDYYRQFTSEAAIDPLVVTSPGTLRMIRGGAMYLSHAYCRSASRHAFSQKVAHENVGIRLVLPIEGVRALMGKNSAPAASQP